MPYVSNPFVKYRCTKCGHEVERQISARHAERQIDELRDGPPLRCAACHQPGERQAPVTQDELDDCYQRGTRP